MSIDPGLAILLAGVFVGLMVAVGFWLLSFAIGQVAEAIVMMVGEEMRSREVFEQHNERG